MAQDNSNMSKGKTIVIVIFAVVLVASLCLPFFSSCSSAGSSSNAASSSSDASSASDAKSAAQVDEDYQAQVDSLTEKLAANSTGSTHLATVAALGNAYMDWGDGLLQASDADDVIEHRQDVFTQAISYYDQYLEEDPDSNSVQVDRAICTYYAGDEQGAIEALEQFVAGNADFSPAWMNLGIFYEMQGQTDEATAAYSAAVEADGKDSYNLASYAQLRMLILQAQQQAASASGAADGSAASDSARADASASRGADGSASSSAQDEDGIAPRPIVSTN